MVEGGSESNTHTHTNLIFVFMERKNWLQKMMENEHASDTGSGVCWLEK